MQERHEIIYSVTVQDTPGAAAKVESTAQALDHAAEAEQQLAQAITQSTQVRASAVSALNRWKAAADPAERSLQQMQRAERDLTRAVQQGLIAEQEKARILEQLRTRMLGTAAANDNLQRSMAGSNSAIGSLSSGIGMMTSRLLPAVAAFVTLRAAVEAVQSVIRAGDAYRRVATQLGLVTDSAAEAAAMQQQLFDVAQRTSTSFEATVQLYSRLARSSEELGFSQADLVKMVETINKGFQLSGASAGEASNAIIQLSQGFAAGVFRGDELNSTMENGSRIARGVADALGVTIGELREMGAQGELTAQVFGEALLEASDVIEKEFSQAIDTAEQATTRLENSQQRLLAAIDATLGISDGFIDAQNATAASLDLVTAALSSQIGQYQAMAVVMQLIGRIAPIGAEQINAASAALQNYVDTASSASGAGGRTVTVSVLPRAPDMDPMATIAGALPTATRDQLEMFRRQVVAQIETTQTGITASIGEANRRALQSGLDEMIALRDQIDARLNNARGGGRGGDGEEDRALRREDSLERYISGLETAVQLEGMSSAEKEIQEALIRAQEVAGRELSATEEQRVRTAMETTNAIKAQNDAQEEANRALEEALEQQRKQYEQAVTRTTDSVVDYASETFADLFGDTELSWEKMWDNLRQTAIQTLARIAAEALLRPIIQPIVAQVVGAAPSLFGLSGSTALSSGTVSGGGGSGISMPNIPGLGDLFGGNGGIGSFLSRPIFGSVTSPANLPFGASPGAFTTGSFLPGFTFGNALSGIGIGAGIGGLLASLTGGNSMGGTIGGGIGGLAGAALGSVIPGVGTLLGAAIGGGLLGAIGGLFGGGKPSVGPNAGANIDWLSGQVRVSSAGADNGGDVAGARSLAQGVADAVNALARELGASQVAVGGYQFGTFGGQFVGRLGANVFTQGADASKIVQDTLFKMLRAGSFQGLDATTRTVISRSGATSIDALINDIQFARALADADFSPQQLTQTEQAIKAINDQFSELTDRARKLGLSEAQLVAARDRAIRQLTDEFDRGIELQILAITDPMQAALETLKDAQEERLREAKALGADLVEVERLAALERAEVLKQYEKQQLGDLKAWLDGQAIASTTTTGVGRLAEAQAQFGGVLAAIRGGAETAENVGRVTSLADAIIGLASQLYGGTAQHAALEKMVRSQVASIGRELGMPGFAAGGDHWGGLRVVGELGPEIEATGPARYWSASQTTAMLGSARDDSRQHARLMLEQTAEIRALRAENGATAVELKRLNAMMSRLLTERAARVA